MDNNCEDDMSLETPRKDQCKVNIRVWVCVTIYPSLFLLDHPTHLQYPPICYRYMYYTVELRGLHVDS